MKTTDVIWTVRSDISRQGCHSDEIKNGVVFKEFVSLYGCILKQWRQCKLQWACYGHIVSHSSEWQRGLRQFL